MNKKYVINELKKRLNCDEEYALKINDIVDDIFLIGRKNKDKMINEFKEKLNASESDANNIYNVLMDIIESGIKDKLMYPFRSQD